jgi:regulator of protease activity HflC (stomatin/prohibitin superfamily)
LNVIEPIIREAVKAESAKFDVAELAQQREVFSNNIHNNLASKFEAKDAVLESVYVVNIELPPTYKESINNKMIAEQNALQAKNKLEQVQFEAQQKVAEAQGKADAMKLEVTALQQNAQILELRMIEKWDGRMPLVVSSGSSNTNTLFDISKLMGGQQLSINTTG